MTTDLQIKERIRIPPPAPRHLLLPAIPVIWLVPLDSDAKITLIIFLLAVWMWVFSTVPDTYVALAAASALVLVGIISVDSLFSPLGDPTMWLLIGAFIIAAAVTASGLAERLATSLARDIVSPRILVHLLTLAVVCTAFVVPATSGRAALILPVFLALAQTLPKWLSKIVSIALPSAILFSAVASLIGAGAHLITAQILAQSGLETFNFSNWLILGLPFALVSSHISTEIVFIVLSDKHQRTQPLNIELPSTQPLDNQQKRVLCILAITVCLWFTEDLHGISPAMVAILGALLATAPRIGSIDLGSAIKTIPWSLLLFMTATIAMSLALIESGATEFTHDLLGGVNGIAFIVAVIVVSTGAHLLIQSRSARSAVLIPIVIALAPAVGVNPVAAAFISTAAAGYCHTLPASAKPLTIFRGEDTPRFESSDLFRVSLFLAPAHIALTTVFSLYLWPALGLDIF